MGDLIETTSEDVAAIAQFEKRVLEAVKWAKENGYTLETNRWAVWWAPAELGLDGRRWVCTISRNCCPLGALLLKEQPTKTVQVLPYVVDEDAPSLFGVPHGFMRSFLNGIEGHDYRFKGDCLYLYDFGRRLREEIHGKAIEALREDGATSTTPDEKMEND